MFKQRHIPSQCYRELITGRILAPNDGWWLLKKVPQVAQMEGRGGLGIFRQCPNIINLFLADGFPK